MADTQVCGVVEGSERVPQRGRLVTPDSGG